MQQLQYSCPTTLEECLLLLQQAGASGMPYAGGTDVMIHLRERTEHMRQIRLLVDLSALSELKGVYLDASGQLHLGAMTTHTEAATSSLLRRHAPFLAAAAASVGSLQIRNTGTIGGNVCNGSPAADTVTPLTALHAEAVVQSVSGTRVVPVPALYGRGGIALTPGELVTEFVFPSFAGWQTSFVKLGRRKALAISRMNVAAALELQNDGTITGARIAPGCVFRSPDCVNRAEEHLIGKAPSRALFAQAGQLSSEEMIRRTGVRWSTEYKQPVLEALVERALLQAAGMPAEE
jgi:CO/xanthine dehydrogenase FAD-binding subunit